MAMNAGRRRVPSQDIRGNAAGKKAMATPAVPRAQMMLARDSTPARRASAPFCLLSVHDLAGQRCGKLSRRLAQTLGSSKGSISSA